MPIVTLPAHGMSNSAAARNKKWFKVLTGVDPTQSNGYAFQGHFRQHGGTVELTEGAWVLEYKEDRRGSGRRDWHNIDLYQVRDGVLTEVESWQIDGDDHGWALHVRDAVHQYMTGPQPATEPDATEPATPSAEDLLLAEREQLLARLAEIDALLPEPEGTAVSTREAAAALGVSVRTVQRWAATGKVDARKDSDGRWIITITITPAN